MKKVVISCDKTSADSLSLLKLVVLLISAEGTLAARSYYYPKSSATGYTDDQQVLSSKKR